MATSTSAAFSRITSAQRRTLLAAALGWMLDAFDAMLYALVLAHIMRDFGMSKATAGLLYTLTLVASGIGGVLFGFIADRIGRKRALMLSILTYSICSFASGLFEEHPYASLSEFFWDVWLVGAVHMASALSVTSSRAGWTRLWRDGHNLSAGHSQSCWNVSRIRQLWLGCRPSGPPPILYSL